MKLVPKRYQKVIPPVDTNPNRPKWTLEYKTTAGDFEGTAFEFFLDKTTANTRRIAVQGKVTPFKPSESRFVGQKKKDKGK